MIPFLVKRILFSVYIVALILDFYLTTTFDLLRQTYSYTMSIIVIIKSKMEIFGDDEWDFNHIRSILSQWLVE